MDQNKFLIKKRRKLCHYLIKLCNFSHELLTIYVIYIFLSIIILISPFIYSIMELNFKIKVANKCLKNLLIFLFTSLITPIIYGFLGIYLPIAFIIIVIIQSIKNICLCIGKNNKIQYEPVERSIENPIILVANSKDNIAHKPYNNTQNSP